MPRSRPGDELDDADVGAASSGLNEAEQLIAQLERENELKRERAHAAQAASRAKLAAKKNATSSSSSRHKSSSITSSLNLGFLNASSHKHKRTREQSSSSDSDSNSDDDDDEAAGDDDLSNILLDPRELKRRRMAEQKGKGKKKEASSIWVEDENNKDSVTSSSKKRAHEDEEADDTNFDPFEFVADGLSKNKKQKGSVGKSKAAEDDAIVLSSDDDEVEPAAAASSKSAKLSSGAKPAHAEEEAIQLSESDEEGDAKTNTKVVRSADLISSSSDDEDAEVDVTAAIKSNPLLARAFHTAASLKQNAAAQKKRVEVAKKQSAIDPMKLPDAFEKPASQPAAGNAFASSYHAPLTRPAAAASNLPPRIVATAPPAAAAAPPPPDSPAASAAPAVLSIHLRDTTGWTRRFKVFNNMAFERILTEALRHRKPKATSLQAFVDGVIVKEQDTPQSLGLKDGGQVDCQFTM